MSKKNLIKKDIIQENNAVNEINKQEIVHVKKEVVKRRLQHLYFEPLAEGTQLIDFVYNDKYRKKTDDLV